jgi:UDP-N-acetylmuramoylalanine--D-glutamate ligase
VKKAVVIGLQRSGVAAANLLAARGWSVTVSDLRPAPELEEFTSKLAPSVGVALGGHPVGLLEGAGLLVISPGVPLSAPPVKEAMARGVKVIGELELAWRHFHDGPVYYAVTGTNGKSTTVSLLQMMMESSGRRSLLAGNIGVPLCSALEGGGKYDCVVAEVSSFQLETIEDFHPKGSAVLNITADHLDRYGSIEDYRDSKLRIARNQAEDDFIVLNADDPLLRDTEGLGPRAYFFSRMKRVRGVFMRKGTVCFEFSPEEAGDLLDASDIRIKGAHNIENAMAASALALLGGCSLEAVRKALREFGGLEHRLEFVRTLDGVSYINDSKGTNVGAVLKSLESFDTPVVLIAGGRDKAGEFHKLLPLVRERARALVLIGEAAPKMEAALSEAVECLRADTMDDAVEQAGRAAKDGDVVLLSPACASFDMFRDFEHRGREFKKAVMAQ